MLSRGLIVRLDKKQELSVVSLTVIQTCYLPDLTCAMLTERSVVARKYINMKNIEVTGYA